MRACGRMGIMAALAAALGLCLSMAAAAVQPECVENLSLPRSEGCVGFSDGPGTMTFTRAGGRESVVLQPNGTAELRTAAQARDSTFVLTLVLDMPAVSAGDQVKVLVSSDGTGPWYNVIDIGGALVPAYDGPAGSYAGPRSMQSTTVDMRPASLALPAFVFAVRVTSDGEGSGETVSLVGQVERWTAPLNPLGAFPTPIPGNTMVTIPSYDHGAREIRTNEIEIRRSIDGGPYVVIGSICENSSCTPNLYKPFLPFYQEGNLQNGHAYSYQFLRTDETNYSAPSTSGPVTPTCTAVPTPSLIRAWWDGATLYLSWWSQSAESPCGSTPYTPDKIEVYSSTNNTGPWDLRDTLAGEESTWSEFASDENTFYKIITYKNGVPEP